MKNEWRYALVGALLGVIPIAAQAEWDFLLDVRPGAISVGDSGDFKAKGPTRVRGEEFVEVEKLSSVSTFPNLKLGAGYDAPDWYFEVLGGVGILINDPFQATFFSGDAAWMYKYRKNLSLGPHGALLFFQKPNWGGDADIEFSDSWGGMLGMQVLLGYDLLFVFSVDYLFIQPFDVTEPGQWRASDSELDLSGVALQFGMRGRF
jgi:hypothetical protein